MADWPVKSLGDKTLLQYAKTPYMDQLARMGRNGRLITVAEGFHPGSEVANMSVLGYNLPKVYEGRGPLEAASIGVDLKPGEMAMRCNLICVEGEILKNHSSGHISTEEADVLIQYLQECRLRQGRQAYGSARVSWSGRSFRRLQGARGVGATAGPAFRARLHQGGDLIPYVGCAAAGRLRRHAIVTR